MKVITKNVYYFIASHKWYRWHGFLADNKRWRERENWREKGRERYRPRR